MKSVLLKPEQVAERLGVAENTLAVWRCNNRYGLKWTKIGRYVRYRDSDVEAFIADNLQGGIA